jgi:hypothetical protein
VKIGSSHDWPYATATPYEILGVSTVASDTEIKNAWRRLTRFAHPDNGGSSALFRLTQEAYELLIDPDRRRDYDRAGANAFVQASSTSEDADWQRGTQSDSRDGRTSSNGNPSGSTIRRKSKRLSFPWLFVTAANYLVATHYRAIVTSSTSRSSGPSHDSFLFLTPLHMSATTLTFLSGDVWIPVTSMLFLAATVLLWLVGTIRRGPPWLLRNFVMVRKATFCVGLVLALPLLITGVLWGLSIVVTLVFIAFAIVFLISMLTQD